MMINPNIITSMLEYPLAVSVFDELASTNLTAREIARSGDRREQVIIARRQTRGRGRLGRSFFSPNGGLYMSLLLFPNNSAHDALHITTAAAVAVARAIDRITNVKCEIKWVNDVYLNDKKICGILTEGQVSQSALDFAVLGIGVNLTAPDGGFPSDIVSRAGAVFDTLPPNADNEIAAMIVNEFYRLYNNPDTSFINEYRERSNLIGRKVDVMRIADGEATPATVIDIADDFSLIVEYKNKRREALTSGEVSVRAK